MKRNAQCTPTCLEGGEHSYWSIILNTTKFNSMAGISTFICLPDTGVFQLQDITTTTTWVSTWESTSLTGTAETTTTTYVPNAAELSQ